MQILMLGAIEIARLAGRTTSTLKLLKTVSLYMYSIGGFLTDWNISIVQYLLYYGVLDGLGCLGLYGARGHHGGERRLLTRLFFGGGGRYRKVS